MSRIEPAPVSITRLLKTLVEVHETTADEGKPRLALSVPHDGEAEDDLVVLGVEGRLVQVIRNLLANAISFSPPDGAIRLSARRTDGAILITVEDDGPGIPEGKLEAIFDRFYTERPAGEKFGTHSGLGLSISKQIIDAHRGTIRAENRRGAGGAVVGARFIVRLPAV
jgi:two-component system sensor histidine kinase ChvG